MGRQFAHTDAHLANQFRVLGIARQDVGVIGEGALVPEHPTHVNVQLVDAVRYEGLLQLSRVLILETKIINFMI